jgi:hypothetical protein
MNEAYVMRRANGDLLAVEIQGKLRIPIWQDPDAVNRYKALNPELVFYWPVKLDRNVAKRITAGLGREGEFLLLPADAPDARLDDGKPVKLDALFPEASTASAAAPANP